MLDTTGHIHIRCGSDIKQTLKTAGFQGHFLEYADPLVIGPNAQSFTEVSLTDRAKWLANYLQTDFNWALEKGLKEAAAIATIPDDTPVTIWCEHDAYDMLMLARLLSYWAKNPVRPDLHVIAIDSHKNHTPFFGLEQLSPDELRSLWDERTPVTALHYALGAGIWSAITSGDYDRLSRIADSGTPHIPQMSPALNRWLADQTTGDTPKKTEQLTIQALESGNKRTDELFSEMRTLYDKQAYYSDLIYDAMLRDMASKDLISLINNDDSDKQIASITPVGRALI